MSDQLNNALLQYAKDPDNSELNFYLAVEYDKLKQYAAAYSFYLRSAEKAEDEHLTYESLIRAARTIREQTRRDKSEEVLLRHAISVCPQYCEGYFLMSRFYRRINDNDQARTFAEQAELREPFEGFITDVEYTGKAAIVYEKAISQWNTSLHEQARNTLYELKHFYKLAESDYKLVNDTIDKVRYPDRVVFYPKYNQRLKRTFNGLETVKTNYSKHLQDLFVLTATNGKKKGTYLEIGSHDPKHNNNTFLLEQQFDWKGISIDIDRLQCERFFNKRNNTILCADAYKVDYNQLLETHCMPTDIDYLQIDVDGNSFPVLENVPLDQYQFGIIHFEHDCYRFGRENKDKSRELLNKHGYVLAVNDMVCDDQNSHEDWWIHPSLIDTDNVDIVNKPLNNVIDYFYEPV